MMKTILAIIVVLGLVAFVGCTGGGKTPETGGGTPNVSTTPAAVEITDADISAIGSGLDDADSVLDDAATDEGVDVSAIDNETF
jgi:hypothetical protein